MKSRRNIESFKILLHEVMNNKVKENKAVLWVDLLSRLPERFTDAEKQKAIDELTRRQFVKHTHLGVSDRFMPGPSFSLWGNEFLSPDKFQIKELDLISDPITMYDKSKNVFVVHGRNENARDSLFQFFRAIGLNPIEWSKAVALTNKPSPFVGEILETVFSHAQAVVVLLTGDDEVRLRNELCKEHEPEHERTFNLQARPNVLFEAGMALGVHPNRTVLVELGPIKLFSDIAGRHVIKMNNSTEKRQDLAERLKLAGCPIDLSGRDWHKVGNFEVLSKQSNVIKSEPKIEKQVTHVKKKTTILKYSIHEGAVKILQLLSDIEEEGLGKISYKAISTRLSMRITAVKHHLKELYEIDYIDYDYDSNIEYYYIKDDGRKFLVENNLI